MTNNRITVDRREFVSASIGFLSGLLYQLAPTRALCGPVAPSAALLSTVQRILLNEVLFRDLPAYLAFDEVAGAVVKKTAKGAAAVAMFDSAYSKFQQRTADANSIMLDKVLGRGTCFDCMLAASPTSSPVDFDSIASRLVIPLGLAGSLAREIEAKGGTPLLVATSVGDVLQGTNGLALIPVVPGPVGGHFLDQRLRLLAGQSGVVSVLAQASIALSKGTALSADFQDSFRAISEGINAWTKGLGNFTSGSPNTAASAATVQTATAALSVALGELGKSIGMNPSAVSDVSRAVNVAGSALAGAMAGSALGPIGTVVGGVVGLVSGLFGARSHGPDQSALAIARVDARITQLAQAMQSGFVQLSAQMATQLNALQQNMQSGFNALSNELRQFEIKTDGALTRIEKEIKAAAATALQNTIDNLGNRTRLYETQYRRFVVGASSNYLQAGDELRKAAWVLAQTLETAGTSYSAPEYVGGVDFEAYLANYSAALAKQKINLHLSPLLTMPAFVMPGVSFEPPDSLVNEVEAIAEQLRDYRYRLGGDHIRSSDHLAGESHNAAAIMHGVQNVCLAHLQTFDASEEAAGLGARSETRELLDGSAAMETPATAPADLWLVTSRIQQSTQQLSDVATAANVLDDGMKAIKPHLVRHYLLTGQNSLPALLYIRRQIAGAIADSSATVFCNYYMAGIDVLRRVASCKMSKEKGLDLPNASKIDIPDFRAAEFMLNHYNRDQMPLRYVSDVKVGAKTNAAPNDPLVAEMATTLPAGLQSISDLVSKIFAKTTIDPTVSSSASWSNYVTKSIDYLHRTGSITRPLVKAVNVLTSDNGAPGGALGRHLRTIRSGCLVLGVIERQIEVRLEALKASPALGPHPVFKGWFPGFKEYGTIAAYALGQSEESEFSYARGVMAAILGDPDSTIANVSTIASNDVIPKNLSPAARPYPVQLGQFWGWGAESVRPKVPTDPKLISALLKPECALAGENGPILAAVETFAQMRTDNVLIDGYPDLVDAVKNAYPAGIKQALRTELSFS